MGLFVLGSVSRFLSFSRNSFGFFTVSFLSTDETEEFLDEDDGFLEEEEDEAAGDGLEDADALPTFFLMLETRDARSTSLDDLEDVPFEVLIRKVEMSSDLSWWKGQNRLPNTLIVAQHQQVLKGHYP